MSNWNAVRASLTPLLVATLQIVLSKWPIWGLTPGVQIGYRPDTRRTEKGGHHESCRLL